MSDYPAGSIGAMFPHAAALMEGLLDERNRLERQLAETRVADVESVLRALIAQADLDRGAGYWRDREQRGIHHPDEIIAWLGSLIDWGWTPGGAS